MKRHLKGELVKLGERLTCVCHRLSYKLLIRGDVGLRIGVSRKDLLVISAKKDFSFIVPVFQ